MLRNNGWEEFCQMFVLCQFVKILKTQIFLNSISINFFTGKPKWFLCFLSHQMQIVHTIIFGGGENVYDFICDANELI